MTTQQLSTLPNEANSELSFRLGGGITVRMTWECDLGPSLLSTYALKMGVCDGIPHDPKFPYSLVTMTSRPPTLELGVELYR